MVKIMGFQVQIVTNDSSSNNQIAFGVNLR